MPYIKHDRREYLNPLSQDYPRNPGELNYQITKVITNYMKTKPALNYQIFNEIVGVLSCVQFEFVRRMVSPYEDKKIKENGDVFESLSRG